MIEIYDDDEPIEYGQAAMDDGIRLHSVTAGSGESLPFVHGTPEICYRYKLFQRFSEDFTVIALDLRGFGDSNKPIAKEE